MNGGGPGERLVVHLRIDGSAGAGTGNRPGRKLARQIEDERLGIEQIGKVNFQAVAHVKPQDQRAGPFIRAQHDVAAGQRPAFGFALAGVLIHHIVTQSVDHAVGVHRAHAVVVKRLVQSHHIGGDGPPAGGGFDRYGCGFDRGGCATGGHVCCRWGQHREIGSGQGGVVAANHLVSQRGRSRTGFRWAGRQAHAYHQQG